MTSLPVNSTESLTLDDSPLANPAVLANASANATEIRRVISDVGQTSRIVVVDDEVSVTRLIAKTLSDVGFDNIHSFNDSRQALDYIADNGVDVVLLDLNIPEIDGIAVLKSLRTQPATQFVPVIVLTSAIDDQTRLSALSAGANDYLTKPVIGDELIQRVKNALNFRHYASSMERQMADTERALRTDALTGLNNRRWFDEQYTQLVRNAKKNKLSLVMFDIDNFKNTNDSFGHDAGDQVLKHVSDIARRFCLPNDHLVRLGGDEFAIISLHETPAWPRELAEMIRARVAGEPVRCDGHSIKTTVSLGIATFGKNLAEKGALFKGADAALYQSKRQGRNTINVYSDAGAISIGHSHLTLIPRLAESRGEIKDPKAGKILIVDDEPAVTRMVNLQLQKCGFQNVIVENDALQAIPKVKSISPDLVILDIRMPGINGLEILREIKSNEETAAIPVLIMTSNDDDRIRVASLKLQANDFLTKPTGSAELDARVVNSLKVKLQHDQLVSFSNRLRHEVEVRTSELFATRRETILCLARAAETRDTETGNHVIRVGHYAAIIARQMGMDEDYVGWIELAAQLHDVGKLSIPDSILHKPSKLTAEEREIVETHCKMADRIFFGRSPQVEKATITSPLLRMAARIASTHHERWDGTGYPNRLAGEDIPIEGRITAVADVFDALSTKRHYKDAFDPEKSIEMIAEEKGRHFDPEVVEAFLAAKSDILNALEQWRDTE